MKKLLLIALLFSIASCKKPKAECVGKPVDKAELAGKFAQYGYSQIRVPANASAHHKFLFYVDSFKLERHSLVTTPTDDSCKSTSYYEYEKGAWSLANGRLTVRGTYTDQQYGTKTSSCYHSGAFEYSYGVSRCGDTLILIAPDKSVVLPEGGIKLCKEQ